MSILDELVVSKTELLGPTLIAAVVSAFVAYLFRRKEIRHRAEVDYEYEQRKKQHELIGKYHGRLLSAANSLNFRLWNLYSNYAENWLSVKGKYADSGYYYSSTVYRFLAFFALIRLADAEAILLDARIATRRDYIFLNYVSAFHWVMTDTSLFEGTQYDNSKQYDHFFSDDFRHYCSLCEKDGECLSFHSFRSGPLRDKSLEPVLKFFDGLSPKDGRLRWDRIVALHLLLMGFINCFGYKRQRSRLTQFKRVAGKATSEIPLTNLLRWLPRHAIRFTSGAWRIAFGIRWRAREHYESCDDSKKADTSRKIPP